MAFATSGPLGKLAEPIPAIVVACARTGLAAAALALALSRLRPGELVTSLRALGKKQRAALALAGALLAAHFALFLAGLSATSLAAAVALVSLEPVAVVVAMFVAFGLRPSPRELVGLLAATLGAVVVASGGGVGEHRTAGDLLVLAAVVLFGAYVASARGLKEALPGLPYATAVYGVAALVLLPLAIPLALRAGPPAPGPALAVLALAVIPTLIGHTLVMVAARRVSPVLVALVSPGETLGSLAIGAFLMAAAPTLREALGAGLILLGATVTVTGARTIARAPDAGPA